MDPKVLSHFGKAIPVAPNFQRPAKIIGAPPRRPMLGQSFSQVVEEFRKRGPILPVQIGIPSSLAQQMQAVEAAITKAKRELINDHIQHCLEPGHVESPATALVELRQIAKFL